MVANHLSETLVYHLKVKHMAINYHFVQELVVVKRLEVKFVNSKDQLANILMKALPKSMFMYLKSKLMGSLPMGLRGV